MLFHYKRGLLSITEVLGKSNVSDRKTDVIQSFELLHANPGEFIKRIDYSSFELNIPNYIIDLGPSEEKLFSNIHKSTKSDIKKAMNRDRFRFVEVEHPTDAQIIEFSNFYSSFAKEKGLKKCNIKKLTAIRNRKALLYTYILDENNYKLCASMLFLDHVNSQLYGIYGVSIRGVNKIQFDKNTVSRANKLLQWKEIQLAKEKGLRWYNFGGEVSQEAQGVNDFKRRFGTINAYDRRIFTSGSLLGSIVLHILYEKWKMNILSQQKREGLLKPKRAVD